FSFNLIYNLSRSISIINGNINKVLEFGKVKNYETVYALIIYFLSYLIIGIILRLIYSLFKVPVRKRVLNKPSLMNKIISMFLGLVNGYVLGMLFMFIFNPLIGLKYDKPV